MNRRSFFAKLVGAGVLATAPNERVLSREEQRTLAGDAGDVTVVVELDEKALMQAVLMELPRHLTLRGL